MKSKNYMIVTNNPLVREELKGAGNIIYHNVSYVGILKAVRDRVYKGHRLLSHPLAGNIRPGQTPYRSVMISAKEEGTDINSLRMIKNAINFCGEFSEDPKQYPPAVTKDFQLIDLELLKSAMKSAEY